MSDVNDERLAELAEQAHALSVEAHAEKQDFVWFGYRKAGPDDLPWYTRVSDQSGFALLMALGLLDIMSDYRDPLVTARIPLGASLLAKRGRGMVERQDMLGGTVNLFAGKLRQLEAMSHVGSEFGVYCFYYLGNGREIAGGMTQHGNLEWLHYMALATLAAEAVPGLQDALLSLIPPGFRRAINKIELRDPPI